MILTQNIQSFFDKSELLHYAMTDFFNRQFISHSVKSFTTIFIIATDLTLFYAPTRLLFVLLITENQKEFLSYFRLIAQLVSFIASSKIIYIFFEISKYIFKCKMYCACLQRDKIWILSIQMDYHLKRRKYLNNQAKITFNDKTALYYTILYENMQ